MRSPDSPVCGEPGVLIVQSRTVRKESMPIFVDDNFGVWDDMDGPDGEDNREFFKQVQRESVVKKCRGCGRKVRLRPDYDLCNSCAEKLERGGDLG